MKNVVALTGLLLMSFLTSAALGAERTIEDYGHSSNGFFPEVGNLKNQRACPAGTKFFKNVGPGLTNGSGAGSIGTPLEFVIDGETVTMSISWDSNNSFGFTLTGGVAHIVGVTSDTNNLLYDYVNFYTAVNNVVSGTTNTPVFSDGDLNKIMDAADVNHLDLCLAPVDTTKPVITFVSPEDTTPPSQVSGEVIVIVTVSDESGVDPQSVTVAVNDGTPIRMDCEPLSQNQYQCEYVWDTESLPVGLYELTVSAADEAVPVANIATVSVEVDVVKLLTECFGILGDEDFPGGDPNNDGYANGCNPTGQVNVQAPPDTDVCNVDNPPAFCFISGNKLKADSRLNSDVPGERAAIISELTSLYGGCDACVVPGYCGPQGIPDPRMVKDSFGNWEPRELVPLTIAHVAEGSPEGVLGKYVYGYKGCFAAVQHIRGGELFQLYPDWPQDDPNTVEDEATGLVFVKTHDPDTAISPGPVALCSNLGQQDVSQAGYQPIGKTQSVDTLEDGTTAAITLAATQACQNPPRTLSRDNGIDVSNIIETDGSGNPVAFKYQRAQAQFDALFVALNCAEPTFLRRGKSRFSKVSSPINQAKAQFDNGTIAALGRARDDLNDAADAIRTSNWDVTSDNCAGDALARTENLAWRMTDLIAAQSQ